MRAGGNDEVSAQKRPRGRPPVPLDRIVTGALQLLDRDGAEALSMRTLAQHLGSGTAVLYRNVGSRAALVALVVDRVFGEVDLDTRALSTMSWERACRTIAEALFLVLSQHPQVASLLVEQVPVGPNALVLRERCLAVLLAAAFPPERAAHLYATLARYVVGFAIQARATESDASSDDLTAALRTLDASRFPATLAVARSLPFPIAAEFEYGLALLMTGARVEHKARRGRAPR